MKPDRPTGPKVHEGSAADLLVLDTGHLVPVSFVVGKEPGRILVETPDGLFLVCGVITRTCGSAI